MKDQAVRTLAGIRVLDFSHVLAGPMCTRLLADLGAEVLRVETAKRADTPWKSTSDAELGRTFAYVMVHRGKKSIAIDLKSTSGVEVARRLATVADVIVENFSAGVMTRLGLDYQNLAPLNPRLVFLSMSGYGHDGPRKNWTSMNSNLQAYSGLMMVTEAEGEPPVAISNSWMDYIGGLHGCLAVVQALKSRASSGKGRHLDLSQFECGVGTLGSLLWAGIVDDVLPQRLGNRSDSAAPQGCYQCAGIDQWCAISVENDAQWLGLGRAAGNPAWAADPRFETMVGRLRLHDEIDREIESWTKTLSPAEVEVRLQAEGVPAERMRRVNEITKEGSGVFHFVPGRAAPTLLTGMPFAAVPQQQASFGPAPRLGEQTEEALRDWLNLEPGEAARLRATGALV